MPVNETYGWSYGFDTEKGVVFIDLPLTITIATDLSVLSSRPAQVRAVMHQESKICAPETVGDISGVLLVANLGTLVCIEHSSIIFTLALFSRINR